MTAPTKADRLAADRVLKAAVREAVAAFRADPYWTHQPSVRATDVWHWGTTQGLVTKRFAEAIRSVEPLLADRESALAARAAQWNRDDDAAARRLLGGGA